MRARMKVVALKKTSGPDRLQLTEILCDRAVTMKTAIQGVWLRDTMGGTADRGQAAIHQ